jgi:hypothetical protein
MKWILLTTAIAILIILITISTYLKKNTPQQPKANPEEYFEFTDVGALVDKKSIKGGIILIKMLHFKMTPIKGNATSVVIKPLAGNVPQGDWPHKDFIAKNETFGVEITFQTLVDSEPTPEGYYPIEVYIYSKEAEGPVTLFIDPDKIVWPP